MSQTAKVIESRVLKPVWQKYGTPLIVVVLAVAVIVTITRNWNGWEGARAKQVTNDAYVRGDLTPLSTKISGIVREVKVNDLQIVHKGDLLVQLNDDDYRAQVAQAAAGVEAAKAVIEDNRKQQELEDAKIERALAGVDDATAQIAAAQAGKDAVRADVIRTREERTRQEALIESGSTTRQKVEQAVAWLSLILALAVIFTNIVLRPLTHRIHPVLPDPAQALTAYEVSLTCRSADESHLRTLLLSTITQSSATLQSIHSKDVEGTDRIRVRADLHIHGHRNEVVEQMVTRLFFEPGVSAIRWSIVPIAIE